MKKNLNIEFFRGLAIFLVIMSQAFFLPFITLIGQTIDTDRGVDLFFVISGYLMGATYISKLNLSQFDLKKAYNFYVKRLARLFPAVIFWNIIMILTNITIFQDHIFSSQYIALGSVFSNLTFVSNFFNHQYENALGYWWSIGLEFQFYMILPIIVYLSGKYFWKVIVMITIILIWSKIWSFDKFWMFRIHSLFLGLLAYKIASHPNFDDIKVKINQLSNFKINIILTFLVFSTLLVSKIITAFYIFTTFYSGVIFSLCILIAVARERYIFKSIHKTFIFLGKISFSLYLCHLIFFWLFQIILKNYPYLSQFYLQYLVYPLIIYIAYLSYKYIEPLMDKKKYMI